MGIFGSLFESKSTSTVSTKITDQRFGASEGASANRVDVIRSAGTTINVGSDDVAIAAIDEIAENSLQNLRVTSGIFEQFVGLADSRLKSADQNFAASQLLVRDIVSRDQDIARDIVTRGQYVIAKGQESADDRLLKIIKFSLLAGVSIFVIQSGALKTITGAFRK